MVTVHFIFQWENPKVKLLYLALRSSFDHVLFTRGILKKPFSCSGDDKREITDSGVSLK